MMLKYSQRKFKIIKQEIFMYNKKESTEDYLEGILVATNEQGPIRAIDLAKFMKFSKASVSIALKKLIASNYILVDKATGIITLTEEGLVIAEETFEKHQVLTKAFMKLGVDEKHASEDACKIEHLLSPETYAAIKKHFNEK